MTMGCRSMTVGLRYPSFTFDGNGVAKITFEPVDGAALTRIGSVVGYPGDSLLQLKGLYPISVNSGGVSLEVTGLTPGDDCVYRVSSASSRVTCSPVASMPRVRRWDAHR